MMKKYFRLLLVFVIAIPFLLSGCGSVSTGLEGQGQYIIKAKEVNVVLNQENTVLVDMQNSEDYAKGHVEGAVNIARKDIMIDIPVENMLAPKGKIEELLGSKGISNETMIVIYDNTNNMDSARFWWTLKVYGHENMKVVSGGLSALKSAGFKTSTEIPNVTKTKYTASDKNTDMIASNDEVKSQVNDPSKDVILLDTRTQEEYDEGTVPGSILLDYIQNNYKDGTYKSIQDIKIQYIENGINPEKTIIMYCKTSVRAAQTYLALYNAGYSNLKLYDEAWLGWSSHASYPIQRPEGTKIESNQQDNS